MARLILDVMGGDKAPQSILQGAVLALDDLKKRGASLVLVGAVSIAGTVSGRQSALFLLGVVPVVVAGASLPA